jgi:23S rRNA pseudouridine1911/1915/1917 synthase
MPDKSREFEVLGGYGGWRLDRFLVAMLPRLSRNRAQHLIDNCVVLSSGRKARASRQVWLGEIVTLTQEITDENHESYEGELPVLYDDDELQAINKPAPLACHPSARYISGTVTDRIPYRLVHRLDRETSGVLLLAKSADAERWYQAAFREKTAKKRYIAWLEGILMEDEGYIQEPMRLAPNAKARLRMEVHAMGSYAMTHYEILVREETRTLVALTPETGRQHQLRVHMAHIGHPIVGDKLYQMGEDFFIRYCDGELSPEEEAGLLGKRMMLHAESLCITSPRGSLIQVKAPIPEEFEIAPQIVDLLWQRKLTL